jgi:hypothetical protein
MGCEERLLVVSCRSGALTVGAKILEWLYGEEVEDIAVSDVPDDCAGQKRGLSVLLGPVPGDRSGQVGERGVRDQFAGS